MASASVRQFALGPAAIRIFVVQDAVEVLPEDHGARGPSKWPDKMWRTIRWSRQTTSISHQWWSAQYGRSRVVALPPELVPAPDGTQPQPGGNCEVEAAFSDRSRLAPVVPLP